MTKEEKIIEFISENQSKEQGVAKSKISSRLGISYYVLETIMESLEKAKKVKKEVNGKFVYYRTK